MVDRPQGRSKLRWCHASASMRWVGAKRKQTPRPSQVNKRSNHRPIAERTDKKAYQTNKQPDALRGALAVYPK